MWLPRVGQVIKVPDTVSVNFSVAGRHRFVGFVLKVDFCPFS